jgi:hypothetical protein
LPSAVDGWFHPPTNSSSTKQLARCVGALIDGAGSADIVDGSVAALAVEYQPSLVVTPEPREIEHLLRSAARRSIDRRGFGAFLRPRRPR